MSDDMDYENLDLVSDSHLAVIAPHGPWPRTLCVGYVDLTTLLRNLAVAGGLAHAWALGGRNGAEWYAGMAVRRDGP